MEQLPILIVRQWGQVRLWEWERSQDDQKELSLGR
jgi:hypothetical protein